MLTLSTKSVPQFLLTPGNKGWGQQSEQREMENRSKFVKDSVVGSTAFVFFFLPADPYQPNRRLVLSSLTSAAITFSQETLGETECIGSFSVSAWINWVTLCVCVCVYSVLKYVYQMCFSSTLKPQSGHVRKLSLPTELKKKKDP